MKSRSKSLRPPARRRLAQRDDTKPIRQVADSPPLQRVGVLIEIARLLTEMNVEPAPFLTSIGVDPAALADIEGRLPFSTVSDLMLKCAEATGRDDFSLALGASARLHHLGIIGKLLSAAEHLGAALLDFVANHPRYVRGASTYLIDWGEDELLIGHRVHHPGLRGSVAFSAGAIAFGRMICAELCGAEPARVLLSLSEPDDASAYRKAFGRTKLVFGAEHFGLIYSRAALARPIPTADPVRHAELRKFVAERWNFLEPDIRERVMRVLVSSVLAGAPSLKRTADLLGMHPRTLNRALEARRFSLREAVNEARFEMASQLLRDTGVSIGGLAETLGYSEVSAFTRFFTRMAGLPPMEWKSREITGGCA